MSGAGKNGLKLGWGQADITPAEPVLLRGQFHARVSEGVRDQLTATALVLAEGDAASPGEHVVMVSCDLVSIWDGLRDAVRKRLREELQGLEPARVVFNATHTHTAPQVGRNRAGPATDQHDDYPVLGIELRELGAMDPGLYLEFAADRIAAAVTQAWQSLEPGAVSWGLGEAVVGHCRLSAYHDGPSKMYGSTDDPAFSHMEGYVDHSLDVLATWNAREELTGLVINLACPSQVSEHEYEVSADFWHDTRETLRQRLGDGLYVLPQCAPAGDQTPRPPYRQGAEQRMLDLKGRSRREEIAARIARGVDEIMPWLERSTETNLPLRHRAETVQLTRRLVREADVEQGQTEAQKWQERYEALRAELQADASLRQRQRWYKEVTRAFRLMRRGQRVATRYALQQTQPTHPVEVHVTRLGDVAFATNPFELYLDYGMQLRARSPAGQTFLVQLAGPGTYLPTPRAVAGGAYGAVPASTIVGPAGGRQLVDSTLAMLDALWDE